MPEAVTDWGELGLALFCFLFAHMLPARPAIRTALVSRLGRVAYIGIYSVLSVGLLMWVARAAARAPYVELWPYDERLVLAPIAGMVVACLLLVFGLSSPNPLSLGRGAGFDPVSPGIAAVVRHPVLWAALIWVATHLVVNGDVSHLVVFGAFGVLAIVGMLALDRRSRRRVDAGQWNTLARYTSNIPFVGLLRGATPRIGPKTVLRVAGAAALYALLVVSHEILAGVPIPF